MINLLQVATEAIQVVEEPQLSSTMQFFQENSFIFMIGIMILAMWLLMWRPEAKRRKQAQEMRSALKKGDKIITAGGIYGVVKEVKETTLLIEVDSNITLRINKDMITVDNSEAAK